MAGYERNTAATLVIFAFDQTTAKGETGDAANLTIYKKEKGGSVTQVTDTTVAELDATNAPGFYEVDLGATEIDTQYTHFFPKSSTADIGVVVAQPAFTVPPNFYLGSNEVVLTSATQGQIDGIETSLMSLLLGFATFGSIADATPAASGFTISAAFTSSDNHYNGLKCYILSGGQKGRRAIITDQAGLVLTLGAGLTAAPENGAIIAIMS